jgi:hypothetical protein
VMQLRKSRFFLFARGSQLDNVVTSPCDDGVFTLLLDLFVSWLLNEIKVLASQEHTV